MYTKDQILAYKNNLQTFLINQKDLFARAGVLKNIEGLNEIEMYISDLFTLLEDLEREINSHANDYQAINITADVLYTERDNRLGVKPDDIRLKEVYNKNLSGRRNAIVSRIRKLVDKIRECLIALGYEIAFIVNDTNKIELMDVLDRITFYAETLLPKIEEQDKKEFKISRDILDKLDTIKEYEESGLNFESLQEPSFLSKLTGKERPSAITGKEDLLRISSLERKILACKYAIESLDPKSFHKTREVLLNFVTRYKNEKRFAKMRFQNSDFDFIKISMQITKEEKEREQRIFSYASTFAMYLDAIDADDEEKMAECEGYLESYQIDDSEMLDARVEGTNMYYANKRERESHRL